MRPLFTFTFIALVLPGCTAAGTARYEQQLAQWRMLSIGDDVRERVDAASGPEDADSRAAALFSGQAELQREALVAAVLARNPSLDAAREGWRAALAEFPQRTALADPMASYALAPLSIPGLAGDVPFGHEAMLAQAVPFPGKLALRGAAALAEADAMRAELEEMRLMLALMASMLHAEYFANARELAVNDEHRALLEAIRGTLRARVEAGEESLQGPLGAELELIALERDRVRILAARDVLVARMNELLHRRPTEPLPPAPSALPRTEREVAIATADALVDEAMKNRPELAATYARIKAAAAEVDMAKAEYWPDFAVNASYNSMFAELPHQFMVGATVDIPIQLGRRDAAVEQAESRRRRDDAELLGRIDAVRADVETERRRLLEALAVLATFDERTLPVAQAAVDAAQAGVVTNRTSFLELLEAERALRGAKLERAQAIAAIEVARARLDRAVGRAPHMKPAATAAGEQP